MYRSGLFSSCFSTPLHNANVEIGERQQYQKPEDAHCSGIADILVDEAGAIDIDDDIIGSVARTSIRHSPDNGKLIETPDELQSSGNHNNSAQRRNYHMPEASPGIRAIHASRVH